MNLLELFDDSPSEATRTYNHETTNQTKIKCIHCGNNLGLCGTKRGYNGIYTTDFFLHKPKVIDGVSYYRHACSDCFFSRYGELPSAPNVLGVNEMVFLLNVPESIAKKRLSDKATTLKSMIRRYGVDIGTARFNEYCEKQRIKNTFEFKHDKYGWTREKFDEYNKSRAVTLDNLIMRHGEDNGRDKFSEYCKKQAYVGVKREYFVEKYGEEKGDVLYKSMVASKVPSIKTFIRKHGAENGPLLFLQFMQNKGRGFSKIAAQLFDAIRDANYIENSNSIMYSPHTVEYVFRRKDDIFLFDFIDKSTNRVIEFFGDYWHMNPIKYSPTDYCATNGAAAEDIWSRDCHRVKVMVDHGFDVKIVWERDFRNDQKSVIAECVEFLNGSEK